MSTQGTYVVNFTASNGVDLFEVHQPGRDALDAVMQVKRGYDHLGLGDYRVVMP